ncbi:MAG: hypothetical protein ACLPTB_07600 [Acidimicrobiales bacterium]
MDTVGLGASALGCVRDGGSFVTAVPEAVRDIAAQAVQVQPDGDAAAEFARRAASGELAVRIADVLPQERFRGAYTRLSRGGLRGKIVLTPRPQAGSTASNSQARTSWA